VDDILRCRSGTAATLELRVGADDANAHGYFPILSSYSRSFALISDDPQFQPLTNLLAGSLGTRFGT
jgi:hypothetical protein